MWLSALLHKSPILNLNPKLPQKSRGTDEVEALLGQRRETDHEATHGMKVEFFQVGLPKS